MKKIILLIIMICVNFSYAQTNMVLFPEGKPQCEFKNKKDQDLFELGFMGLQNKKLYKKSTMIFLEIIKNDSTQCDSYFFAGYALRLQNKFKEATVCYYMADSLSNNKSLIYKQSLATAYALAGGFELARKKFNEITEYFPKSPEGYYGIATSAIILGDFDHGLSNLNKSISIYKSNNTTIGKEVYLTKAILLAQKGEFEKSLLYFDQISGIFSKNDDYRIYHAYSLMKVGISKKDKTLTKKANKLYKKIENKSNLSDEIKTLFNDK